MTSGGQQQVHGATGEVENAIRWTGRSEIDQTAFPASILSVREKSGDEIVTVGDCGEKLPNVAALAFGCGDRRSKRQ